MLQPRTAPTPTTPPQFFTAPPVVLHEPRADARGARAGLTPERRKTAEAMRLYMRLSALLRDALAERDRHAYRRTLRVFRRAARRVERRYDSITPRPALDLGNVHAAPAMPRARRPEAV